MKEVTYLITINVEYCNGCGACVEVCPDGAIYLVDGKATVDGMRCRDCAACIDACPKEAIACAGQVLKPQRVPDRMVVLQPGPETIQVKMQPASVPLRTKILPVVSAALVWAGREIVPRLAGYALNSLDRWESERGTSVRSGRADNHAGQSGAGGGRRHRQRRRGR